MIALAVAVAVVAVVVVWLFTVWRWGRLTKQHGTVTLDSGVQYDGIILERTGGLVKIGNARLLVPNQEPVPIDGVAWIERRHVTSYQTGYTVREP